MLNQHPSEHIYVLNRSKFGLQWTSHLGPEMGPLATFFDVHITGPKDVHILGPKDVLFLGPNDIHIIGQKDIHFLRHIQTFKNIRVTLYVRLLLDLIRFM